MLTVLRYNLMQSCIIMNKLYSSKLIFTKVIKVLYFILSLPRIKKLLFTKLFSTKC